MRSEVDSQWFVGRDGESFGPYTFNNLVKAVRSGELRGDDWVWQTGMEGWSLASTVADLWVPPPGPDPAIRDHPENTLSGRRAQLLFAHAFGTPALAAIGRMWLAFRWLTGTLGSVRLGSVIKLAEEKHGFIAFIFVVGFFILLGWLGMYGLAAVFMWFAVAF